MRHLLLYCLFIASFSANCRAQGTVNANQEALASAITDDETVVVSYHIEERINSTIGTFITTYDVPTLDRLVPKDLGPDNTRTITPKYAKIRAKAPALSLNTADVSANTDSPKASTIVLIPEPVFRSVELTKKEPVYAYIDVTSTYERILNKGYKSVDLLKKVANRHYYDGDLTAAAKWYGELFDMTPDLDETYYYRYAQSLKSVNNLEKAGEMMSVFESKTRTNR